MISLRRALACLVLVLTAAFAHAQAYTSIVVFGDSLSDTGNDTFQSNAAYGPSLAVPSPYTGYTLGRFTDGIDTTPAAVLYKGVWVEQFAALLAAKPAVVSSLNGGNDYAYGFAFTGAGTTPFTYGPGNALSFTINNMQAQVASYLATTPTINSKTLFVVWGGANDLLNATSSAQITTAATNELTLIQSLISAGATDFLVVNLPPLGSVPRVTALGAAATTALNQSAVAFNSAISSGLAALPAANTGKTLHFFPLDVYTLFNNILAAPTTYGFANVTTASNFLSVNPDTYLFWDSLHPTTAGHHLIANAALTLVTPSTTTTTVASSALAANLGASVTFTATVKASSGVPTGTVTFYDGTNAVNTAQLTAGTASSTATYTVATLTAGTHPITATYTPAFGFTTSTSTAISEVVTAPAVTAAASPASLTITSGNAAGTTITVTGVGGYTGYVQLSCGALPARATCNFTAPSVYLTSTAASATSSLTINTSGLASLTIPQRPGSSLTLRGVVACSLLPFFGLLALRRRRSLRGVLALSVLLLISLAGMAGCSSSATQNTKVATGTYTIPIAVAATTGNSTVNLTVIVQ